LTVLACSRSRESTEDNCDDSESGYIPKSFHWGGPPYDG